MYGHVKSYQTSNHELIRNHVFYYKIALERTRLAVKKERITGREVQSDMSGWWVGKKET